MTLLMHETTVLMPWSDARAAAEDEQQPEGCSQELAARREHSSCEIRGHAGLRALLPSAAV